ncbi:MAG: ATP-binding protein [Candidatus Cloacimonetes bacterium]|nr:ATP-binding protein [Candidatus Cloacimonadota bacterium]
MEKIKSILYGISSFADISGNNAYYVDKTMFIPEIEKTRFNFFIRPRRFGKSMLLSMLGLYYDIHSKEKFDTLFKETWIHEHHTEERGKYLILYLDFSAVAQATDDLQKSFNNYCNIEIWAFMRRNKEYIHENIVEMVNKENAISDKLNILVHGIRESNQKFYIFIDEYDNFTNALLSEEGAELYHQITSQNGFFKDFFRTLKTLTSGMNPALSRLFMTGVSPITLDDVSSGFNIGTNISLIPEYNTLLGFTENDVSEIFDYYIKAGQYPLNKSEAMHLLRKWYDNYLFSSKSEKSVYNTDGVLYFMTLTINRTYYPEYLIDENLRMDYTKLQNLVFHGDELNGNFDILTEIINTDKISANINKSFPFNRLKEPENYKSFLYFLGLLTFTRKTFKGKALLQIPNETLKHLVYDYIKGILRKPYGRLNWVDDMINCMSDMAYDGDFKPAFEYIQKLLNIQTSVRDFKNGEAVIKTFHLIYLNINDFYISYSEKEMNKGFADITLFPFYQKYPDMKYAYLIELKYIKKDFEGEKLSSEIQNKIKEATEQLEKYSEDHYSKKEFSIAPYGDVVLKKLIVIYQGWEMVYCEELGVENKRNIYSA